MYISSNEDISIDFINGHETANDDYEKYGVEYIKQKRKEYEKEYQKALNFYAGYATLVSEVSED